MSVLPKHRMGVDILAPDREDMGSWRDLGSQFVFFLIVYASFSTFVVISHRVFSNQVLKATKKDKQYWIQRLAVKLLGSPGEVADKHVARNQPILYLLLNLVQFCASVTVAAMWISKSYTLAPPSGVEKLTAFCLCSYFALHGLLEQFRNEWRISECYKVNTITDVLSCTSLLVALIHQDGWLSLGYLRAYNAYISLVRLVRATQKLSDFQTACLLTFFKFITLMTISAATMFLVEALGDMDLFDESTLRTHNEKGKPISFFIMLYYSFVSISTVGYGDIYPESGLGRIVAIIMIFGGIIFFSKETSRMLELSSLLTNGQGAYRSNKGHVIVTGGAVDNQNLHVFGPFVEELCHPSRGQERPQVLLVSSQLVSTEVRRKLLKQWWAIDFIRFLQGSLVRLEDMKRTSLATAKRVYIIGDMDAEDHQSEDEKNLATAVVVRNVFPHIDLKVLLLKRNSKKLGAALGLPPFVCYSNQNLEGLLLINHCRAPGIPTILSNMIKQDPILYCKDKSDHNYDYVEGLKLEIHGVLLKPSLLGLTFTELAFELYSRWEIVLIGLMTASGFHCSCDSYEQTNKSTIAYLLPRDKSNLDFVSRRTSDWDGEYCQNLESFLKKRQKVKAATNQLIVKSKMDFHEIPSFRNEPTERRKISQGLIVNVEHSVQTNIIILCHSNRQWEVVHVIARNIRQMQTTFQINVLLLCPYEAPEDLRSKHRWVNFVVGEPTSIRDLTTKAKVGKASRIIVLSEPQSASSNKRMMQDQKVIFVTSILEQEFKRIGRSVPVVVTFNEGPSHKLLPGQLEEAKIETNCYHLRSGQIVLVRDLLRVLAATYYTPGILDVLMTVLSSGENSSQALWSLHPYKYIGKTFAEMYMSCLKSETVCFAIYRRPENGKKIPFVWTLPPGDTILKSDDLVYVMASKDYILEHRMVDVRQISTRKIQRAVRKWLKRKGYAGGKGGRATQGEVPLGYKGYFSR